MAREQEQQLETVTGRREAFRARGACCTAFGPFASCTAAGLAQGLAGAAWTWSYMTRVKVEFMRLVWHFGPAVLLRLRSRWSSP
jgi:hypothetical protein